MEQHTFDIRYRTVFGREKTTAVEGTGRDEDDAFMDAFDKVEAKFGARRALGGVKRAAERQ